MALRIHDLPPEERPREKLLRQGPASLSDPELLAIFLRVGTAGHSAIDLARDILSRCGSLVGLSRSGYADLADIKGIGEAKAAQLAAAVELGNRLARERLKGQPMNEPALVYELLGPEMRALRQESLRVLLLDTRHHLLGVHEISKGTLDESVAHPREILRPCILHSAYGFILVHNHPSGQCSPSQADRELTRRIQRASAEMGIHFVDHVILGGPQESQDPFFSFREFGLL